MLMENDLKTVAISVTSLYKEQLEKAHLSNDNKSIVKIMEESATHIIHEFTRYKAMGDLTQNFNRLINHLLETFPRFCYYFDLFHQLKTKSKNKANN
jgi:hypothetical protein